MSLVKINLKQRRWLLIPQLLLAVVIAVLLAASNSQTSQAASLAPHVGSTHCADPGNLIDVYPIKANGTQIGEIDLYYNRSTGYNCAWTRTAGEAYGKAQHITIGIDGCDEHSPGPSCSADGHDDDMGDYHTYAGPAGVQAPGYCISLTGFIMWNGQSYAATTNGKAVHCGK